MMITIPSSLVERDDLSLLERALIPLIASLTQRWGEAPAEIEASVLAEKLRHSPREVVSALDALTSKKILVSARRKTPEGMMVRYRLAPLETVSETVISAAVPTEYIDSNHYLNLSNERFEDLHAYAIELCDREGVRRDVFEDFNLYQRSQNRRSFDWHAEFERWMRRESAGSVPAASSSQIEESKPTSEIFELTQYFIRRLASIDPQFQEPFDVMSWAKQIQLLIEAYGYTLLDIKGAVDWLFSAKGEWFRPNVPDAYHLRKHFKRIVSHTRSHRDGKTRLPDNIDLFDLYEKM